MNWQPFRGDAPENMTIFSASFPDVSDQWPMKDDAAREIAALDRALKAEPTLRPPLIEYEEGGQKVVKPALFWRVQFHPVKRAFVHIDFYGVDLDKEVKLVVPVEFTGVAQGAKLGGKLETYREKVTLKGKPMSIPARVVLDITDLGVNDTVHVSDLKLPEGVKPSMAANYAIVSVISREAAEAEENEGI